MLDREPLQNIRRPVDNGIALDSMLPGGVFILI
jgi:hypothetical protein